MAGRSQAQGVQMKLKIFGEKGDWSAHGEHEPGVDPQLMPCPFCGGDEITVSNTHSPYYKAQCEECNAVGPPGKVLGAPERLKTKHECKEIHVASFNVAINYWNIRP